MTDELITSFKEFLKQYKINNISTPRDIERDIIQQFSKVYTDQKQFIDYYYNDPLIHSLITNYIKSKNINSVNSLKVYIIELFTKWCKNNISTNTIDQYFDSSIFYKVINLFIKQLTKDQLDIIKKYIIDIDKTIHYIDTQKVYKNIQEIIYNNEQEFTKIIQQNIDSISKIFKSQINDYNNINIELTEYGEKLIPTIYKYLIQIIKSNIRDVIANLDDDIKLYTLNCKKQYINIINNINICPLKITLQEYKFLLIHAYDHYESYINNYIKKYIDKHSDKTDIIKKIKNYILDNIYNIFLNMNLAKDENNAYNQSWVDENGKLLFDGWVERDNLKQYLIENKDNICTKLKLNLNDNEWENIIDIFNEPYYNEIIKKIYDLTAAKNSKLKINRSKNLLELHDGVGESTNIDYDITNDYIRTRPIIIVQDINGKNYVLFGRRNSSHSDYVANYLPEDCKKLNITLNNYKMGYGYLLGKIAFVDQVFDELAKGYTFDDIVNILKNDPRIVKVYTTPNNNRKPGGGKITRLARIINF